MAKITRAAQECVSREIAKHCHKKKGRCLGKKERRQAAAIGYSICRREGYRISRKRR
jgi:hypothetical protein